MKRTEVLIIGDLHTRHEWIEELISKVKPKTTVFLGDYFDQFGDSPEQNRVTAEWLRYSIHQTGRLHILGNHDLAYCFPNVPQARCPGFTKKKLAAISSVMQPLDWAMCHMFVEHESFMITHAGIQASYLNPMMDLSVLGDWMSNHSQEFWETMERGGEHWFLNRGESREPHSPHRFGGVVWADFSELVPLPGWNQVCGHTPSEKPRMLDKAGSSAVCLDTLLPQDPYPRYCGRIDRHGNLEVSKVKELLSK